jgi:tRNA nucleotidyltransferase (CCA-adding enzyme)
MTAGDLMDMSVIPDAARRIASLLEGAGLRPYLVGGAVRDMLLGKTPADFDLASGATPEQAMELLGSAGIRVLPTGLKHGTVTAVLDGSAFEVTMFRREGGYEDSRHPTDVSPAGSMEEDLSRRDFTINAMALSFDGELLDPYGGGEDLRKGLIRTVGHPADRFAEDALRILRALRFASRLGFDIEDETASAMWGMKDRLALLSKERIGAEFAGVVSGHHAADVIRRHMGIFLEFVPEFAPMVGFDQRNVHHAFDVMEHSLVALASQTSDDPAVRFATLFHDIGKPERFFIDERGGHFHGHAESSARITGEVLRRLRYSRAFSAEVVLLIKSHMVQLNACDKSIRRQVSKLGEETFFKLLDLKRSDIKGLAEQDRQAVAFIDGIERMARELGTREERLTRRSLAIDGHDVIAAGVAAGPRVGEVLEGLFDAVLEGEVENDRESLLALVAFLAGEPEPAPSTDGAG